MIVLDTTVLVYAKGADHPLRDWCRGLLAAIGDGLTEATTTVEVIQEFVHVRTRRRGRADAAQLGRDYTDLLSPLLAVGGEDLRRGLDLYEQVESLDAFDAVLAGVAIGAGAAGLISADRAFASVPRLTYLDPSTTELSQLIADG